jgi:hypothetical protein
VPASLVVHVFCSCCSPVYLYIANICTELVDDRRLLPLSTRIAQGSSKVRDSCSFLCLQPSTIDRHALIRIPSCLGKSIFLLFLFPKLRGDVEDPSSDDHSRDYWYPLAGNLGRLGFLKLCSDHRKDMRTRIHLIWGPLIFLCFTVQSTKQLLTMITRLTIRQKSHSAITRSFWKERWSE